MFVSRHLLDFFMNAKAKHPVRGDFLPEMCLFLAEKLHKSRGRCGSTLGPFARHTPGRLLKASKRSHIYFLAQAAFGSVEEAT